ncbi:MAG: helix-turn-helix transcriptional regulator [Myxococcaceae bacterium]
MRTLEDLEAFVEAEARAESQAAVAELEAERARFRLALELGDARQAQGLTQIQLSRRSGVPQSEISKVESGANPTATTLLRIVSGLGFELKLTRKTGARALAGKVATRRSVSTRSRKPSGERQP